MRLFESISDEKEEVEISSTVKIEQQENEGTTTESRLKREVEEDVLKSEGSKSSSAKDSSGLPGVSYGSSDGSGSGSSSDSRPGAGSRSKDVDLEDIHSQNKKIIGLLKDIKSEVGGGNQLL